MSLLILLLACGKPTFDVGIATAHDVPPPPEHCSLDLGPADFPPEFQPGAEGRLNGDLVSIVDRRERSLTVYAPEMVCESVLMTERGTFTGP